ncbi:phosphatidylserine decarboxylase [Fomitiporia mediterranea MF3/22]|uniref:phosphatidylserine decarboxylase n=1 Tax=Fomitiporia mediterranea (strain MF3/22) TaxID=694068 RepID=UPI0004408A5A|nr:phosphatidylserine decarboxylase [Fomitiporia mediterranea MF3/22]EJD04533.1 phosphatidylserine decarboxylase [Fomitiporia mediterranea MF3/22]
MLPYKQGFLRRTTSHVYRGGRRHVKKYVAHAIYAGRKYSQYRKDSQHGSSFDSSQQTPLHQKLADAWRNTPTKWYPLPVLVGALLLVALNIRKRQREYASQSKTEGHGMMVDRDGDEVIRLHGPFHVNVLGALPLRNLSRLWGYLNSVELPVWFRPTGFTIYSKIFGVNLEEVEHDLPYYKSLGEFFYRRLKEGVRPIDDAILVSPADGKILHFGTVEGSRVEQVKGLTYSLNALLGKSTPSTPTSKKVDFTNRDHEVIMDREFADINGIEYSLEQLLGSSDAPKVKEPDEKDNEASELPDGELNVLRQMGEAKDVSVPPSGSESNLAHDASVALAVGRPPLTRTHSEHQRNPQNRLYFTVIYLAPGDYHRFHSPAAWVVEQRRHFVGELFSVSPYIARRLPNLFVLNERVALLGRWAHGFFSMTPVGATNVGSILLNFDRELRTNVRGRRPPPGTFMEAVYSNASKILRGKPLRPGEEMGGFCLGSTIVLVFEAPKDFVFDLHAGQKVKVGQRLGDVKASPEKT